MLVFQFSQRYLLGVNSDQYHTLVHQHTSHCCPLPFFLSLNLTSPLSLSLFVSHAPFPSLSSTQVVGSALLKFILLSP